LKERVDEDRLKWASETSDGIRVRGKKSRFGRRSGVEDNVKCQNPNVKNLNVKKINEFELCHWSLI